MNELMGSGDEAKAPLLSGLGLLSDDVGGSAGLATIGLVSASAPERLAAAVSASSGTGGSVVLGGGGRRDPFAGGGGEEA